MLVALEGLEGVGKTTLGEAVARELSATYLKTPPPEMNGPRRFVAQVGSPHASFYFYLSSLCTIQAEVVDRLDRAELVIVDRYLNSTIAYHAGGTSFEPPAYDPTVLVKPDLVVLIWCDQETRIRRLMKRGHHIYERPQGDEDAISKYFAAVADVAFLNDRPFAASVTALAELLRGWLRQQN